MVGVRGLQVCASLFLHIIRVWVENVCISKCAKLACYIILEVAETLKTSWPFCLESDNGNTSLENCFQLMSIHIVVRVWARDTSFSNRVLMYCTLKITFLTTGILSIDLNPFTSDSFRNLWLLRKKMLILSNLIFTELQRTFYHQRHWYDRVFFQRLIPPFASKETEVTELKNPVRLTAGRHHRCCNKNTLCVDNPDTNIWTKIESNYHATHQSVSFV